MPAPPHTRAVRIALAGNPNSGKTTVFNAITGQRQHVGNYPGVTVDKKVGRCVHQGRELQVTDLPGTYSLTAYADDEVVARNLLLEENFDCVVDVIDASNLERSLYLATQLAQLGVPLVLAFNMSDVAEARGLVIDDAGLSRLLGVPIVRTVGHKRKGIGGLLTAAVEVAGQGAAAVARQTVPRFGQELETEIEKLTQRLACDGLETARPRWLAIKLLEDDAEAVARLKAASPPDRVGPVLAAAEHSRRHLAGVFGDSAEIVLADRRYGFISGACQEAVRTTVETRHIRSDKVDAVLTNRLLGLPIFAVMMYLVFQLTFWVGNPVVDVLDGWKASAASAVRSLDTAGRSLLVGLLADGVIEGVGAVLVFVPLIALLFLAIALLEDSGYMARAAFVLDRLMHRIGLHGKSFIPMLLGFGCTVPAVMATRTLETRRDRLTTMLVLPLFSCGARLPVYVLILGALFPPRTAFRAFRLGDHYLLEFSNQALLLFGMYVIGIVLAVLGIKVLRATLFRGEVTPFVMELPPYRLPTVRGLLLHVWEPTCQYLRKAGTIILAAVVVLWALKTWPVLPLPQREDFQRQRQAVTAEAGASSEQVRQRIERINLQEHREELTHSAIGRLGRLVAPVLAPCGFDWKVTTALLGATAAKEVFVGQMGVMYAVGEHPVRSLPPLRDRLAADYTPLQGLCMMLFVLVASPCIATVAVTVRESGSWKWALLQWVYLTLLAWVLTAAVYQAGSALGIGTARTG